MIYNGDCLEVLAGLPENSVDTCITDPPYGLGFMGKQWDTFDKSQFGIAGNEGENDLKVKKSFNVLPRYRKDGLQEFTYKWASEVYRVLKPGGLLLSFGGTRTYHRIVCAIEDAGFEIRDCVMWVHAQGFPKSLSISKAIDKKFGKEREKIGRSPYYCEGRGQYTKGDWGMNSLGGDKETDWLTAPATPEAQLWDGWGTQLKPAYEPIVIAQKPLDGTYAENALKWGVAGLNIDGGRVETSDKLQTLDGSFSFNGTGGANETGKHIIYRDAAQGRFPANLIHDGSDEVVELFPQTGGGSYSAPKARKRNNGLGLGTEDERYGSSEAPDNYGDSGSAARFFYCAKASRSERNAGLEGMEEHLFGQSGGAQQALKNGESEYLQDGIGLNKIKKMQNHHPTVKPIELMRYLVRLTKTPTGGVVLDPFMGSGTTGIACVLEGREFIGIEREPEYVEIAEKRIAHYRLPIMDEVGA